MLPIFSTVLLSQKLFLQKGLISEGTKLLKYLDFACKFKNIGTMQILYYIK